MVCSHPCFHQPRSEHDMGWPIFASRFQDGRWMLVKWLPNHLVFVDPTCQHFSHTLTFRRISHKKKKKCHLVLRKIGLSLFKFICVLNCTGSKSDSRPKRDLSSIRRHLPCSFPPQKPAHFGCRLNLLFRRVLHIDGVTPATPPGSTETASSSCWLRLMDSATECMVSTVTIW